MRQVRWYEASSLLTSGGRVLPLGPGPGQVLQRYDQRRVRHNPRLPAHLSRPLGERPGAVVAVGLRHVLFRPAALLFVQLLDLYPLTDQVQQHTGFQLVIPHAQRAHPGRPAHPVPVLAHAGGDDGIPVAGGKAAEPAHGLETGRGGQPHPVAPPPTALGVAGRSEQHRPPVPQQPRPGNRARTLCEAATAVRTRRAWLSARIRVRVRRTGASRLGSSRPSSDRRGLRYSMRVQPLVTS